MKRVSSAVVGSVFLAVAFLPAQPAVAACVGPSLRANVVDGRLSVTGEAFGTACHDSGPPPQGQGVLGEPGRAIQVVLSQRGMQQLVAVVDASADYTFGVDVPLVQVEPGTLDVSATYLAQQGTGFLTTATAEPVPVSTAVSRASYRLESSAPPGSPPVSSPAPPSGRTAPSEGSGALPWWVWPAALLLVAGFMAGRRSARGGGPTSSPPAA